jgi:hypothetical protein
MRSNVLTMCAMSTFSTGRAAAYLGVGVKTPQRRDREGRLKPERAPSGRRAYSKQCCNYRKKSKEVLAEDFRN